MNHNGGLFHFLFPVKNGGSHNPSEHSGHIEQTHTVRDQLQKIPLEKVQVTIVRRPEKVHADLLRDKYNIHPIHQEDILSKVQRPKIDFEENYIFFVLHLPLFNEQSGRIETSEIDFFYMKTELIVIINEEYPPLEAILSAIQKEKPVKGSGFLLYQILDNLVDTIFPLVEQIERSLDEIDKEVFIKTARHVIKKISFLRRNVIYFQTMVKPEMTAFKSMGEGSHTLVTKELKIYFSNITDHFKKLFDRLEDAKELTDNLSLTFENYLTFRTNETIKYLTIFSVILLPLTLLTGIYGMNLDFLPLASHPGAIFFFGGLSTVIVTSMLIYFRYKHFI